MFFSPSPTQYTFKYIIVGDSCVGKSCLLLQFTQRKFEHLHDITIGVEFGTYTHSLDNGDSVKLQIWDTAGQESFRSITRSYYRHSLCALVVFDITNLESYNNIVGWIRDVKMNNNPVITIILIGNKCDLEERRKVKREDAEKFAKDNDITYIETSARTSQNVQIAFLNVIPHIYKMIKEGKLENQNIIKVQQQQQTLTQTKPTNNNDYCSQC